MTEPLQHSRAAVVLMNEAALDVPVETLDVSGDVRFVVAGSSLVKMTLAELCLPGAQMIWTDFRQSASLRSLHAAIAAQGGLDRIVLAGDGQQGEAMFSLMCAILTFLPALRDRPGARIVLVVPDGAAVTSLRSFLQGLATRLKRDGIAVLLQIEKRQVAQTLA